MNEKGFTVERSTKKETEKKDEFCTSSTLLENNEGWDLSRDDLAIKFMELQKKWICINKTHQQKNLLA